MARGLRISRLRAYSASLERGAYAWTGYDVGLTYGRRVTIQPTRGQFAWTGYPINLTETSYTATLNGSNSGVAGQPTTYTITLSGPANQTFTVTRTVTIVSGALIVATNPAPITAGNTTTTFSVTANVGSYTVDFTISPSVTRAGRPITLTVSGITLSSAAIQSSGTSIILTFSGSASVGSGGSAGWALSMSGGAVTMTYASGAPGTALTYTLSRSILAGETGTIGYTQPGNGIEATAGGADLLTFSGTSVTNNVVGPFPLSVHASGRYLVDTDGDPFLIHGDTPWSIAVQLTTSEIDTYIEDRAARGFNAIMFNAIEHRFSSQTPRYRTVDGYNPFNTMTNFGSGLVEEYWTRVDHIVDTAKSLGMLCIINPAYFGFGGGTDGWTTELTAASAASLQTYGAALANRYTQGNIIWCLGGDYTGTTTERQKQWNIVTGMRSVRTSDIVMAHPTPYDQGYDGWNGYVGWNLNTVYFSETDGYEFMYQQGATAYATAGPLPFIYMEGSYEQEPNPPIGAAQLRRQSYSALLAGACGQFFGNNPIWHFESPETLYPYSGTWESNLNSTGSQQQTHFKALFDAYDWWKLAPSTGTGLVTSSLSSGTSRIYPALASDGTFAMIWVPSSQTITVNTNALTGVSGNVRIRRYNGTDGTWTSIQASIAKTSAQSVATGAEGVIVIESDKINFAWDANPVGDNVTSYRIYVGTSSGSYSGYTDVGNVTSYAYPYPGATRYYALTAVNAIGESVFSDELIR